MSKVKRTFMSEGKLLIITLMAFFLSLLVATNASAAGKIAFTSNRDGNIEIYVMNADGSGQTRLTTNAASDRFPAWSPDGLKIAKGELR
jgi:redox-regulated HSP33 family molecular chaperone